MNTVGSPKAPSASRMAWCSASSSWAGSATRRMPRPPPPATALTKTGNPISWAASSRVGTSEDGAVDFRVGMPAALAAASAVTLLPASSSTSAGGPMKVMPASAHAAARSGFSLRKP
jgi:hypothetical protein